jgi:hypothetical protein
MNEPPDKTRVIRLVKKPQQPVQKVPPATPPPEAAPKGQGIQPRRVDRHAQPLGPPAWKKGPPLNRRPPRRPPAPARPKPTPIVLTEEQRVKILSYYRDMVIAGERPPEGRRKKIAAMLNIPYANVAEVVKSYLTHERYRRTNFDIERAYWQHIRAGEINARSIAARIANQLALEEGRVWWWLEKLHEPRKSFATDPEIDQTKRASLLALYETYLQRSEPPEKGLHEWLAEQVGGLIPRQVHNVLWDHRMSVWKSLEGTQSEPPSESATPPHTG